jgi:hypothetical protein
VRENSSKYDHDRPNSVLTTPHRDHLVAEAGDSDKNLTPVHRQRIRKRMLSGTKDLGLLYRHLDDHDIQQAFESQSREQIIDGICFFLRVSSILDEPIEEVLEEAIDRIYSEYHSQKILGEGSVQIETANRKTAAKRAKQKIAENDEKSVTPIELQALAEKNYHQLSPLSIPRSEEEFVQLILDNVTVIDDELEVIDRHPKDSSSGATVVPDAVAKNGQNKLVVIEVKRGGDREAAERRLHRLIKEYGGPENVHGILVMLDNSDEQQPSIRTYRYRESTGRSSRIGLDEFLENANPL